MKYHYLINIDDHPIEHSCTYPTETKIADQRICGSLVAYLAKRDGKSLDYLCLANEEAFQWAENQLTALIRDGFTWLKLDFNIDPKLGCNQKNHDHGEGDWFFAREIALPFHLVRDTGPSQYYPLASHRYDFGSENPIYANV